MPTAENARLEYEAGRQAYPMSALTDSGDHKTFTSNASLFSRHMGSEPDVRPNGLITGGAVKPAVSGSNDVVDVAALTCNLAGVKTPVNAALDQAITRPVTDIARILAITVNSSGAIAVVAGTDGADANFVETRNVAGGPPYIPVGSIEIAQVRINTSAAAPITAAQIFQVVGLHQERYDFPIFTIDYRNAAVVFGSALDAIHTGGIAKAIYASYADPIFQQIAEAVDFVPSEESYSVASTQIYGGTKGSSSKSLGQGSFTAFDNDGVTGDLIKNKGQNLWFRFLPDRTKLAHILTQGRLGIARSFPADGNIQVDCTISAETASVEVES